jgi:acyl-CoA thioester hydrolase
MRCENAGVRRTKGPSPDRADYPFTHRLRARFAETDAMGVVHHAAYLPWLEEARVAYLRFLGHPYGDLRDEGTEFPVIEVACSYRRPVHFDAEVEVRLRLASCGRATFELDYLLEVAGAPVAAAVTVHAVLGPEGRPRRTPEWLRALGAPTVTPGVGGA